MGKKKNQNLSSVSSTTPWKVFGLLYIYHPFVDFSEPKEVGVVGANSCNSRNNLWLIGILVIVSV